MVAHACHPGAWEAEAFKASLTQETPGLEITSEYRVLTEESKQSCFRLHFSGLGNGAHKKLNNFPQLGQLLLG